MRKLIKKLQKWNLTHDGKLDKWQRNTIFDFITNDFIKEVKK